jgi:hypothetical protein
VGDEARRLGHAPRRRQAAPTRDFGYGILSHYIPRPAATDGYRSPQRDSWLYLDHA